MGGGHHDHHGPPYKVPDYRIYKVDKVDTPELYKIQNALAAQGLKDPWMRNEVWRYSRAVNGPKTWSSTWGRLVFRKAHFGLGLAIAVVALEKGWDAMSGSGDHHGHGGHH